VAALAGELDLPLTRIGRLVEGQGVRVTDAAGEPLDLGHAGWQHF
jgi:thiamine-monophosphate kinase